MQMMRFRTARLPATALAAVALCLSGRAAPAAEAAADTGTVAAEWKAVELNFLYQGLTAKYSCLGLRHRLESVLLKLGARPDMQLQALGCTSLGGVDPFPSVRVNMNVLQRSGTGGARAEGVDPFPGVNAKMSVLQPALASGAAGGGASVPAHWATVDLVPEVNPVQAAGDCELLEQIKTFVLPLFATRNVDSSFTCVPNQLQNGAARLRVEVLVSDTSPSSSPATR
jgi:hypothetical protein